MLRYFYSMCSLHFCFLAHPVQRQYAKDYLQKWPNRACTSYTCRVVYLDEARTRILQSLYFLSFTHIPPYKLSSCDDSPILIDHTEHQWLTSSGKYSRTWTFHDQNNKLLFLQKMFSISDEATTIRTWCNLKEGKKVVKSRHTYTQCFVASLRSGIKIRRESRLLGVFPLCNKKKIRNRLVLMAQSSKMIEKKVGITPALDSPGWRYL